MSIILFLLVAGLLAISLYMIGFWVLALKLRNAGVVDVGWALGFIYLSIVYSVLAQICLPGSMLLSVMYWISSGRLFLHLLKRFLRSYPQEDPRYTRLRADMGANADLKMLLVFLFQGVVLLIMTVPMIIAFATLRSDFGIWMIAGFCLWLGALIGETLADQQLTAFANDPANKGKTCQVGLWHYSRHPNYFFEWLTSVAFALYVIDAPYGIWALICPTLILYLLFYATGIKPSEAHSLLTRSDYAEYMRTTSVFIPLPRRKV